MPAFFRHILYLHLASILCFAAALAIVFIYNTNQLEADLMLGLSGYVLGGFAWFTSIVFFAAIFADEEVRRVWRLVFLHVPACLLILICGFLWLAFHMV